MTAPALTAVTETLRSLADFLFPPACILCGADCPGERPICAACARDLNAAGLLYEPSPRTLDFIDRVTVLLPYDTDCRTIVHAFKYKGMPSAAFLAGTLMAKKTVSLAPEFSSAPLVPVPLHPVKLRERGYNQCRRIADGFSSFAGNPIREDLVARMIYTGTQTALDRGEREKNVRGAFAYCGERSLAGSPVILIDDVMTTGSTLSECAWALRDGGAGSIMACVAATPDPGED